MLLPTKPKPGSLPKTAPAAESTGTRMTPAFNGYFVPRKKSDAELAKDRAGIHEAQNQTVRDVATAATYGMSGPIGAATNLTLGALDVRDAIRSGSVSSDASAQASMAGIEALGMAAGSKYWRLTGGIMNDAMQYGESQKMPKPAKQWGQPRIAGHAKGGLLPGKPNQAAPQDATSARRLNLPNPKLRETDEQTTARGIVQRRRDDENRAFYAPKVEAAGKVLSSLGAPQRKMMQGLTGTEQTPGEYLVKKGYLSPDAGGLKGLLGSAGKVAADVVADPMNLVGAGIARKIAGVSKMAKTVGIMEGGMEASVLRNLPEEMSDEMVKKYIKTELEPAVYPAYTNPDALAVKRQLGERLATDEGKRRLTNYRQQNLGYRPSYDEPNPKFEVRNIRFEQTENDYAHFQTDPSKRFDFNGQALKPRNVTGAVRVHPELSPEMVRNVTRHELQHSLQSGVFPDLDQDLSKLELVHKPQRYDKYLQNGPRSSVKSGDIKFDPKNLNQYQRDTKKAVDYFANGSGGKEKAAFVSELQQHMVDRGYTGHAYDTVTPELVERMYNDYQGGATTPLRILDIAKPTPKNFDLLARTLNQLPAVGAGAVGAAAVGVGAQRKAKGGLLPGKLTMLGPDGKPQMELGGGNRIFSRADTRELVSRSLKAKTPAELRELGGRIRQMLDKQDGNKPEYVSE